MNVATTDGIQVRVETFYQSDYSNPLQNEYMHSYRITIENRNKYDVKLMNRHWDIRDSDGQLREVEGEGVIGITPVIQYGTEYQYVSGCNLYTPLGTMSGWYTMQSLRDQHTFKVYIPTFTLEAPMLLN